MQGGSRRSALYGSLSASHGDIWDFLHMKNWHDKKVAGSDITLAEAKKADFNYPAPLDMMNISTNYSDEWLHGNDNEVFMENCKQALMTGEPGFSFNFGDKKDETLRNACCEITSFDDSDVCNLGSVNLANIETIEEFKDVVHLASKFLVCGLIRAHLPYEKVERVRQQNSRIGLGLMGMHEWLLKRGHRYEMNDELKKWMKVYESESTDPLTNIVSVFFSTVLKDTERLLRLGLLASSQEQPLEWNQSTPWHTADAILQMEQDGSISLSLTVRPTTSSREESNQQKLNLRWTSQKMSSDG